MRLFIAFDMLIYSSYKMMTIFANVTRFTSCTKKFVNQKRLQEIGCGVFDREIICYFRRSVYNFHIIFFAILLTQLQIHAGVDISQFAKKDDLPNLKSEIDKLCIDKLSALHADKLKPLPVSFKN